MDLNFLNLGRAFGVCYAIFNASQGLGMAAAGLLGDVLSVVLVLNVQALLYLASGVVAYLGLRAVWQQRPAVRQRATVDVG